MCKQLFRCELRVIEKMKRFEGGFHLSPLFLPDKSVVLRCCCSIENLARLVWLSSLAFLYKWFCGACRNEFYEMWCPECYNPNSRKVLQNLPRASLPQKNGSEAFLGDSLLNLNWTKLTLGCLAWHDLPFCDYWVYHSGRTLASVPQNVSWVSLLQKSNQAE